MHPGKQVPIELFCRDGMKRDVFNDPSFPIRHHTAHHILRALDQALDGFKRQMLADGFVFRRRRSASQCVSQNSRLGRECHGIVVGLGLPLGPLCNHTGHVIDEAVHAALRMMAVRRTFGDDKQMAFVRHS